MLYLTPTANHISAAEQAFRRGDREAAYQQVRAALLCDPHSVDAWLWLSKLVDDSLHQRECFERVLAIDPANRVARDGLETLRLKQLLATMQAPIFAEPRRGPGQIGLYLVERAVITADQLQEALYQQRVRRRRGEFVPLGDILLKNGWVTPARLANALVMQLNEKLRHCTPAAAPQFLGEYLVVEGLITAQQLEAALAEQMRLSLIGQRVALGSLLIRRQCIEPARLHAVLEQQRTEFYGRFSD